MAIRIKQARHDAARHTAPVGAARAGDLPGQETPRWQLVFHDNGHSWRWCRMGIDGSIEHVSGRYPDFGLAMGDAVRHGFCARDEDWAIKTQKWTTHFPSGKTPFSIQAEGAEPLKRCEPHLD